MQWSCLRDADLKIRQDLTAMREQSTAWPLGRFGERGRGSDSRVRSANASVKADSALDPEMLHELISSHVKDFRRRGR
jgi:hypothetical protein